MRYGGFVEYARAESRQLRAAMMGEITVTSQYRKKGHDPVDDQPFPVVNLTVQWTPSVGPYIATLIAEGMPPPEPSTRTFTQTIAGTTWELGAMIGGTTLTFQIQAAEGGIAYTPYVVTLPAAVQAPAPVLEQMQTEPVFGASMARLVWAMPPGTQLTTGSDPSKAYLTHYQIQWPKTPDSGWLLPAEATASAWFQVTEDSSEVVLTAIGGTTSSAVGPTLTAAVPAAAPANFQAVWQLNQYQKPVLAVTMDPPSDSTIAFVTIVVDNTSCTHRYSHHTRPIALVADPIVLVADPSLDYFVGAWFSANVDQTITDPSNPTTTSTVLDSYLAGVDVAAYVPPPP